MPAPHINIRFLVVPFIGASSMFRMIRIMIELKDLIVVCSNDDY